MNTKRDLTNIAGYIYKITSPNGDVYIGQTINIKIRRYSYKKGMFKKQTKLWNNCQKYNWNPSDSFEIIDECLCGEEKFIINEREIYWVEYYDSYKNGLNCTKGGKGQVGKIWTEEEKEKQSKLITEMFKRGEIPIVIRNGHKLTEEHKNKIKESRKQYLVNNEHWLKGKNLTEEHKEKISNSVKGEKNGFYGKKHTIENREKMSKSHIGIKLSEERRKKMSESHLKRDKTNDKKYTIPVLQYDMHDNFIEKFYSIKEASEKTGSHYYSIIEVCKGRKKETNNYIWKYENSNTSNINNL